MEKTARDVLLTACPELANSPALVSDMLERPEAYTLGNLGCSVKELLARYGIDRTLEMDRRMIYHQELPPSFR